VAEALQRLDPVIVCQWDLRVSVVLNVIHGVALKEGRMERDLFPVRVTVPRMLTALVASMATSKAEIVALAVHSRVGGCSNRKPFARWRSATARCLICQPSRRSSRSSADPSQGAVSSPRSWSSSSSFMRQCHRRRR
jgi:hypothetical protein